MDLVPDSCEFTDDLEKDFVIVQALKAAIKMCIRDREWTEKLQIQSFQAVLSVMVLVHHLQRFSEYCQIPHSHRM